MAAIKKILVMARDDAEEAMRVAAGLTIFGHKVRFLFADEFEVTPRFEENANCWSWLMWMRSRLWCLSQIANKSRANKLQCL